MKALILALFAWISTQPEFAGYEPENLPIVYQGEVLFMEGRSGLTEKAHYYPDTGVLIILGEFDRDSIEHRAILLHELVHHAQRETGISEDAECLARFEPQAYRLMHRYMEDHGLPPPTERRQIFIALMAQCPPHS